MSNAKVAGDNDSIIIMQIDTFASSICRDCRCVRS
jgi:hypothetical protein